MSLYLCHSEALLLDELEVELEELEELLELVELDELEELLELDELEELLELLDREPVIDVLNRITESVSTGITTGGAAGAGGWP